MTQRPCSEIAAADEPLAGTAPIARAWVAIEHPATAAPNATDVLPEPLRADARRVGVKLVLLRRPGTPRRTGPWACLLAGPGRLERAEVDRPDEVLAASLDALVRGEPSGLGAATAERHYLVCTNGKRDRCCARLGRPVVTRLAAELPRRVWECSHLGGHRFAANLLALPDGLVFGRLHASAALDAVARLERGELALEYLRGRSVLEPAQQAAEILARLALGETAVTARVPHLPVVAETLEPRPISCGSVELERPVTWRLSEPLALRRPRTGTDAAVARSPSASR